MKNFPQSAMYRIICISLNIRKQELIVNSFASAKKRVDAQLFEHENHVALGHCFEYITLHFCRNNKKRLSPPFTVPDGFILLPPFVLRI